MSGYLPLLTLLALLLLPACAKSPQPDLVGARKAVARAYSLGADHLATDPYQAAYSALQRGEEQIRAGDYDQAKLSLAKAEHFARTAVLEAREEQIRLEEELKAREKEERKKALHLPPPPEETEPEKIPPAPAAPPKVQPSPPPPTPAPVLHYDVRSGDTLWKIAARPEVYGDPLLWPLLYKANRDQIKDPRQVYSGQTLEVPRGISTDELEEIIEQARQSEIFPISELLSPDF